MATSSIPVAIYVAFAIAQGQAPDSPLVNVEEAQALCGQYDQAGRITWDAVPVSYALLWQRTAMVVARVASSDEAQAQGTLRNWCAVRASRTTTATSALEQHRVSHR